MNQRKYVFLIILLSHLLSLHSRIQLDISNPQFVVEYDFYIGAIHNINDTIISSSMYKIIQFNKMPNGELERLSFFEIKEYYAKAYLDEGKLFLIDYSDGYRLRVLDVSVTPIIEITSIPLNIVSPSSTLLFSGSHILISDYHYQRMLLINKENYGFDGYIYGLYGEYILLLDNILIQPIMVDNMLKLKFMYINEFYEIEEITLFNTEIINPIIYDFTISNHKLLLCTDTGINLIDISSMDNPYIQASIPQPMGFKTAILFEDLLFACDNSATLRVFQISEQGNYHQVHTQYYSASAYRGNLLYVEGILYLNAGGSMLVIDIENNFQTIASYGSYASIPNYTVTPHDIYLLQPDLYNGTQNIISILENRVLCTLSYPYGHIQGVNNFYIIDDKLCVSIMDNNSHYLDIYQISNELNLLNRIFIRNSMCIGMSIKDNIIIFTYNSPQRLYYMN